MRMRNHHLRIRLLVLLHHIILHHPPVLPNTVVQMVLAKEVYAAMRNLDLDAFA